MNIRIARTEDSQHISALMHQLGYQISTTKVAEMISDHQQHNDEIYVGIQNNEICAVIVLIYFTYFPDAQKLCRITALVVDEKLRGKGLGTALLNRARDSAIQQGCSSLELTTNMRRHNTHAYYEHLGFEKTSYKFVMPLTET